MSRLRCSFGLRTLMLLVALVGVALWAIPAATEWIKWRMIRSIVIDTMAKIAASPGKPAIYYGIAWRSEYVLANVEVKWDPSTGNGTQTSSTPRSDAVFVEMPGKVHAWARSPDEVMQLLQQKD